jgi:hypothetical protein
VSNPVVPSRRGVTDIRTHSGNTNWVGVPHAAFLKIGCLEMEKARREKEKDRALARVRVIDERIAEIEGEKEIILKSLEETAARNGSKTGRENGSKAGSPGFRIKY